MEICRISVGKIQMIYGNSVLVQQKHFTQVVVTCDPEIIKNLAHFYKEQIPGNAPALIAEFNRWKQF